MERKRIGLWAYVFSEINWACWPEILIITWMCVRMAIGQKCSKLECWQWVFMWMCPCMQASRKINRIFITSVLRNSLPVGWGLHPAGLVVYFEMDYFNMVLLIWQVGATVGFSLSGLWLSFPPKSDECSIRPKCWAGKWMNNRIRKVEGESGGLQVTV